MYVGPGRLCSPACTVLLHPWPLLGPDSPSSLDYPPKTPNPPQPSNPRPPATVREAAALLQLAGGGAGRAAEGLLQGERAQLLLPAGGGEKYKSRAACRQGRCGALPAGGRVGGRSTGGSRPAGTPRRSAPPPVCSTPLGKAERARGPGEAHAWPHPRPGRNPQSPEVPAQSCLPARPPSPPPRLPSLPSSPPAPPAPPPQADPGFPEGYRRQPRHQRHEVPDCARVPGAGLGGARGSGGRAGGRGWLALLLALCVCMCV